MKYFKLALIVLFFVFLLTNCGINAPPAIPDSPVGPVVGLPGLLSDFKASTTDRNNDDISYQFDWGDGTASQWSDFISSGDTVYASRLYVRRGTYGIRVRAQDARDEMSLWSRPFYLMVGLPDTIVWGVGTGVAPFDIEMLPNGQRVYVTNSGSNNLSVISGSDHSVLSYVSVGVDPRGITALPNSQRVYVMINGEDYVLSQPVYGGSTATIPVPDPLFAAAHPSGEYVYVTSSSSDSVYVIRTFNDSVVDIIDIGTVFVFDTLGNVIDTLDVAGIPQAIAALPNGQRIYVSDEANIFVISASTNTVLGSLPLNATDMVFSPDGQYLYGCSPGEGLIFTIRTSDDTPVAALEVGFDPYGLAVHPSGRLLYVSDNSIDNVSVICIPENVIIKGNLRVFNGPKYIAASPNGEYIYVLHNRDYAVGVIGFSEKIVE